MRVATVGLKSESVRGSETGTQLIFLGDSWYAFVMPRQPRNIRPGLFYHVLNRSAGRITLLRAGIAGVKELGLGHTVRGEGRPQKEEEEQKN
jgi:hypothetical protein